MAKTLRRDGGYVGRSPDHPGAQARRSHRLYVDPQRASPQRIAAEEQRYRDIHAGARRYHEGRGPDWTRVTAFHLLAALGAAATLSAPCAGLLVGAAWLAGREGGLAARPAAAGSDPAERALAGGAAARAGRHHWPFSSYGRGDLSHEIPVGGQDEVGRVLEAWR